MNQNQLTIFAHLEANLSEATDQLCTNSKLTSSEHCMLVLSIPGGDFVRAWCTEKNNVEVLHG